MRQDRLTKEMSMFEEVTNTLNELSVGTVLMSLLAKTRLKDKCYNLVKFLSNRVHEQRVMLVRKSLAIGNMMKRIHETWMKSPLAHAISYLQTEIIQLNASVRNCLSSIDNMCYYIAVLNGTDGQYVKGFDVPVILQHQSNYICLRELDTEAGQDFEPRVHSDLVKQRTTPWFEFRNNAVVTGSTLHNALGLGTLKNMQEHFDNKHDKENGGNCIISQEMKDMFAHGTNNEISALATLVGKILPTFYPQLSFQEDGCDIINLPGGYYVISGDGLGVNQEGINHVAFEFKCPMLGKKYTTETHYKLPVYYVLHVLSQMAAKNAGEFANLCYTQESSTLLVGEFNKVLWGKTKRILDDYSSSS